jgi:hypothetical protein
MDNLFDDEELRARREFDGTASFDRAYGLAAFALNRFIIDHLLRFGRNFGADYSMLLVWGVVAHQSVIHLVPMGELPSKLLNEEGMLADTRPELRPVRLRDLWQITGLPKETIRRKLLKLAKAGWITQHGQGWVLNRDSLLDLRDFSRESTTRLLATAEHVRWLLKDAGLSKDTP